MRSSRRTTGSTKRRVTTRKTKSGPPDKVSKSRAPDFFVAHTFSPQKIADLRRAVTNAFRGSGLTPYYADLDLAHGHILDKIHAVIRGTQFGVFDVTAANPNVYLELGLAIASGKPHYIIAETGTAIGADLEGLGRVDYIAYADLEDKLKKLVLARELQRAADVRFQRQLRYRGYDVQDHRLLLRNAVARFAAAPPPMRHRFGRSVEDEQSVEGTVWEADLSHYKSHLVFGPYKPLSKPGRYVAVFRIRLDHNNYSTDPALTLEVVGATHGDRHIYAAEWEEANTYRCFGVNFDYEGKGELEYRVYNMGRQGIVRVDFIAVLKLKGEGDQSQIALR